MLCEFIKREPDLDRGIGGNVTRGQDLELWRQKWIWDPSDAHKQPLRCTRGEIGLAFISMESSLWSHQGDSELLYRGVMEASFPIDLCMSSTSRFNIFEISN